MTTNKPEKCEEMFDQFIDNLPSRVNETPKEVLKSFIKDNFISKEEVNEWRISWDTASNGDNWVVQIWRKGLGGNETLYQEISQRSDDGGCVDLPLQKLNLK